MKKMVQSVQIPDLNMTEMETRLRVSAMMVQVI